MPTEAAPILFLADLHGNTALFNAALAEARARLGHDRFLVVASGDFCDNGPSTPALLDRCLAFAADHPGRFLPIAGNHDLACLLALGDVPAAAGVAPDAARRAWWERWGTRYANSRAVWTPAQYGASSLEQFERQLPGAHREFLRGLPWFRQLNGYVFVHAELQAGPVAPQLATLARRSLDDLELGFQPPQLRDKSLATINDPSWEVVVVSGHSKLRGRRDLLASHRLTLHSGACRGEPLHAALLPGRVSRDGLRSADVEVFTVGP